MTYFSGEWQSIPVAEWERIEAVIDAAREHVNDPEVDLPADWNVPHTPTFAALLDAVRALDGKTND